MKTRSTNPFVSMTLIGKDLNPNEITEYLSLSPYKSFKRGDQRTETEKWKHGYWEICSVQGIKSPDITLHFSWLVNQLTPVRHKLTQLIKSQNINAEISCFWILPTGQSVFTLPPELLIQLADLGLKIEMDIYCDS